MKSVICDSGIRGTQYKLHEGYDSFAEFEYYDEVYKIASRLGFKTARTAWIANPLIQSSVNHKDLRRVR